MRPASKRVICTLGIITLLLIGVPVTYGQTYEILHSFNMSDGYAPQGLVTIDSSGNLYSTTSEGGTGACEHGCGTVFKLSNAGSGWFFETLHLFTASGGDGATPTHSGVVIGPDGALYGVTSAGGAAGSYGTVYRLIPQLSICRSAFCPWMETPIYRFQGGVDGAQPEGNLVFDQQGNIYGTTRIGGTGYCQAHGCGTVYELTRSGSSWTKKVLYNFDAANDGTWPGDGLVFDSGGNLYGTTAAGAGCGSVFRLSPLGSDWTETVLYTFTCGNDGGAPGATPILDGFGNLYGTTPIEGACNGGTAYELSPSGLGWQFNLLATFCGFVFGGPPGKLVFDGYGNLFGMTNADGHPADFGEIFKLVPGLRSWTQLDLLVFRDRSDDGALPVNGLTPDGNGGFYGVTTAGGGGPCGPYGCGVVFDYVPAQ